MSKVTESDVEIPEECYMVRLPDMRICGSLNRRDAD